jgi:hypothetical protein
MTDLDSARQRAEAALFADHWVYNFERERAFALARDVLALCAEVERLRKIETAAKELFRDDPDPADCDDFLLPGTILYALQRAVESAKETGDA